MLHGDAAFPGQGVVAETLNLQALDGYSVGGTVHLIQNNQVGFTTDPDDSRSTHWASDLAKGFDVPIIHVNADDPAACISAVRLAFAYRQQFGHDVVIDLIGYRRFGHNEADEPAYTQPEMYAKIKQHKRVVDIWADLLVEQGTITPDDVEEQKAAMWDHLSPAARRPQGQDQGRRGRGDRRAAHGRVPARPLAVAGRADRGRRGPAADAQRASCCGSPSRSRSTPSSPASSSGAARRSSDGGRIDWGQAEALAIASLVTEGTPIRLTGQDSERGTFSQRHMVLHDAKTGQTYSPIQHLDRGARRRSSCTTRR